MTEKEASRDTFWVERKRQEREKEENSSLSFKGSNQQGEKVLRGKESSKRERKF